MNKQNIINYLQNMREYVPDEPLKAALWQTNKAYLKSRIICVDVERPDKIIVAGTHLELPLNLISTTDYDTILLNMMENEFEQMDDFKLVNNTHKLIECGFRLVEHEDDWIVIRLRYDWESVREFVKFLYFISNDFELNTEGDDAFYRMVISCDNYLPDLRSTYVFEDINVKLRYFAQYHGNLMLKFDKDRDKYLEPMIRLNVLRCIY